jgi:hypothetical protein
MQASGDDQSAEPATGTPAELPDPGGLVGFGARGRMRRRARFLRKARELAYRDLGGLVFNLHRFGQRNDALVVAKLATLSHIDGELRTLETALQERQAVTILREAGIAACPRCAAIHGSDDRFCPNCGLAMDRHAERPVASGAPVTPAQAAAPSPGTTPSPAAGATPSPAQEATPSPASRASPSTAPGATPSPTSVASLSPTPASGATPASNAEQPTQIVRPPDTDA